MLTIAWYLAKVLLCSGILVGYYWFVLRNRKFHRYNRFYLLASVLLSWIIPIIEIDFWKVSDGQMPVVNLLTTVVRGDQLVVKAKEFTWDWNLAAGVFYVLISTIFLVGLIITLTRIRLLISSNTVRKWNNVYFVFTNARGTPFSFLKYIFWNEAIHIDSVEGQQMLKHELAHVSEKHTLDKLFMNLVLVIGWYNPFAWLIRKELNMIHEFIADQKSVSDGDAQTFALMLLKSAYPLHSNLLVNSFFHSPIKRRLIMLTTSNKPRFSYLGRLIILPLVGLVFVLFAFKIKEERKVPVSNAPDNIHTKMQAENSRDILVEIPKNEIGKTGTNEAIQVQAYDFFTKDTSKKQINRVEMLKENGNDLVRIVYDNGGKVELETSKMLVIVNGKKMTWKRHMETLNEFLLNEEITGDEFIIEKDLLKQYGEEGKDGLLVITSKKKIVNDEKNINDTVPGGRKFDKIFTTVEKPPVYSNDGMLFAVYIQDNLQYPNAAIENKVEGTVYIQFVVDDKGNLSDFTKVSAKGYGLEEEAIRLIKNSGQWQPGIQNGHRVAVQIIEKITFTLPNKKA